MVTNRVEIIGVILDLWNTLIYDLPSIEAKRREDRITRLHSAISMAGHVVTRKNLSFAYDSVASIIQSKARKHKGMSIREQINIINEVLRIKVDSMTLAKEVSAYNKTNIIYKSPEVPGACKLIERLSRRYRLGLISNTERGSGEQILQAYPEILRRITVTYFSDNRGYRKPHKNTFLTVATELKVDPDQCVMIGDNEVKDCKGAEAVGMHAILFANPVVGVVSDFAPQVTSLTDVPTAIQKLYR